MLKVCTTCKEAKPLSCFSPMKAGKHGVAACCKPCFRIANNARNALKREELAAKTAAYIAKDPAAQRARVAATRAKDPDKARRKSRETAARKYAGPEGRATILATNKRWRDDNRPLLNSLNKKREALKRGSEVKNCPEVIKIYELAQRLSVNGLEFHVDHITPLSKGGAHIWENLQVIPASANLCKGAKLC